MSENLILLAEYWLVYYVLLLAVYFAGGCLIQYFNHSKLDYLKIQEKHCPDEIVKRDIKQSVKSLASIALFLALGRLSYQLGYGFNADDHSPALMVITFLLSLFLFDTWFYWFHRLIHSKFLFKHVHRWHHQTVTPTLWSNNSDSFLDNLFLQSYWAVVHFLFPVHPVVILVHKIFDQVTGMLGHSGYEYCASKLYRWPSPLVSVCFHDQHHSAFHYNYATHFTVWDKWMGTMAKDYEQIHADLIERKTLHDSNNSKTV